MKWVLVVLIFLFGLLLFGKGVQLWVVRELVGENGMDIYFLGFEVMGNVLKEAIPNYAFGFAVAAIIPMFVAINLAYKYKQNVNNHRNTA